MRTMHPWERDARLIKKALNKPGSSGSLSVLVEIACTRSSEELLGARRAYHSLFDHSIEEDVAYLVHGSDRKVLSVVVLQLHTPIQSNDVRKHQRYLASLANKEWILLTCIPQYGTYFFISVKLINILKHFSIQSHRIELKGS